MKTTIGGDRLGSGNKQIVSDKTYERSTHDLSYLWRSTMASGTLVPFMNIPALPGDSIDIDLNCEVMTLPTVGPLFGSFKVQLDVFQVPIRLYNAALHMNKLGIGMEMSKIKLPKMRVWTNKENESLENNAQVNTSSLIKYLGVSGIGKTKTDGVYGGDYYRDFNGVPVLAYWDIYKNYYANKQESQGVGIHTTTQDLLDGQEPIRAEVFYGAGYNKPRVEIYKKGRENNPEADVENPEGFMVTTYFEDNVDEIMPGTLYIDVDGVGYPMPQVFEEWGWRDDLKAMLCSALKPPHDKASKIGMSLGYPLSEDFKPDNVPSLHKFDLDNIDEMRVKILQHNPQELEFILNNETDLEPYNWLNNDIKIGTINKWSTQFSQEMLGIKTYQSDLFNNWIITEWIDGENGINAITAIDTTGDNFTLDTLNLSQKVYNMLNRIAISGGTYDDWLDAVYTHERSKSVESPVYMGSLIKELAFEEVISTADTEAENNMQPLGTLAGRGRLTQKNKGGKIKVKVDEPSYIMGIVSLTPRIDYSQGNEWHMNLDTLDDFHKPALDAIGYQDLITEQMAWQSTEITYNNEAENDVLQRSAGKQPAWINYMTAVNKTFGGFAEENNSMFMTLNRRYEIDETTGAIEDLTTYIDPTKFNHIFAQTSLDAQNFWVQISNNITARRKMSAKQIPNL